MPFFVVLRPFLDLPPRGGGGGGGGGSLRPIWNN